MIGSATMRRMLHKIVVRILDGLPDTLLQDLLAKVATRRAKSLLSADGLRFLFNLDTALYKVEGELAVAYDVAEKAGARVVGIDHNESNIAIANQRYVHPRVNYVVGNALQYIFDECFDVVIISNVLEHLTNRPQFLRQVQDVAHPSRFLIRVPLFERDWRVPLKRELGVEWRLDTTHETEYTLESFAKEIKAANLKIISQEVRWGEIWAEVVN